MAHQINRLSARTAQTMVAPRSSRRRRWSVLFVVDKRGGRRWAFIYRCRRTGRLREMGLGGLTSVSLARARQEAASARATLASGCDPIQERRATRLRMPTFGEVADGVVSSLESGWRNDKHRAQWRMTLATYAAPLRAKPVDEITTEDVLAVLRPIWSTKAETASRVRGRIEKVIDAAKARGLRHEENPARWRGHLDHLLSRRQRLQRGHHPAMPFEHLPAFVARLRARPSIAALALQFLILTAARSGEILRSVRDGEIVGARWQEINFSDQVWTVPPRRMKSGREHRVPLSDAALGVLGASCRRAAQ